MRKLFSTTFPDQPGHLCLLVSRMLTGAFMLTHGIPKLLKLTAGGKIEFADPFGFGSGASLALVVFSEFLCSVFIIIGLGTRLAALFLLITMLVAAFHAHADDPFGTKEKALLYMVLYLILITFGSGKYSADQLVSR